MASAAFTKFDPRAFLSNERRDGATAKPAKVAKAPEPGRSALATLATLAAGQSETDNFALPPAALNEAQEERAAIVEHDGGAPRAWAEGFARLDPNNPPGDLSAQRWLRFIDDCGRFLDSKWADEAAALGWGPLDLFGCDRVRPFARIDHMGLLWLINGGTLLEMHRDHAIVETVGGARQTYRRKPVEVGRVMLAWEPSIGQTTNGDRLPARPAMNNDRLAAIAGRGEQIKSNSVEHLWICCGVKPPLLPDKPVAQEPPDGDAAQPEQPDDLTIPPTCGGVTEGE